MLLRILAITLLLSTQGCGGSPLKPWHTERLHEEFSASKAGSVLTFADYLELEDRLYAELDEKVYAQVESGPDYELFRYSAGSAADPRNDEPDWNRTFELTAADPVGGVLLLHGMSDSPYSLRVLARALNKKGYQVIGLRMPGHGTAPSGLKYVRVPDMVAAVHLAMDHLAAELGDRPIHIVGYSTGASLALGFAVDAMDGNASPVPASLVLISPAIRVHSAAALARFKHSASSVPGLSGLAWLQVMPEFDPYKYNSFATNAGDVVHRLTRSVDRRIASRAGTNPDVVLPPTLVFKSTVDTTVTTEAVVDNLLALLKPNRHELVLFDINRASAKSMLLVSDPGPLTNRLMADDTLPFTVTVIVNEHARTRNVITRRKAPFSAMESEPGMLDLAWPPDVISLSHVALSFPPDDPLYGRRPPNNEDLLFLGEMAMRGERGLLALPEDWLLRMRYNPFYSVVETRSVEWIESVGGSAAGSTP
jgi:alpha-beta hydrolase superfamily lysophospholipase